MRRERARPFFDGFHTVRDGWSDVYCPHTAGPCVLADLERDLGAGTMARLLKRAARSMTDEDLGPLRETHRIR